MPRVQSPAGPGTELLPKLNFMLFVRCTKTHISRHSLSISSLIYILMMSSLVMLINEYVVMFK